MKDIHVKDDRIFVGKSDAERETGSLSFLVKVIQEIRLPLVEIVGFSNVVKRGVAGENRRLVQTIHSNGTRVVDTLKSILDLVQIESGSFLTTPQRIDVVGHVREVMEEFRPRVRERGLWLKFIDPEVPVEADMDPAGLRRIVSALLSNAVNFTPKGGIMLGVRPRDGRGEVVIRDTGCGISRAFLPRVFEPFVCEEFKINGIVKGNGLGLTIAKRLVDELRGDLEITSTRGEGTTCIMSFPASCRHMNIIMPQFSPDDENEWDVGLDNSDAATEAPGDREEERHSGPATVSTAGRGASQDGGAMSSSTPAPEAVTQFRPYEPASNIDETLLAPGRPLLLLVEDNGITRRVMQMMLVPDYNVVSVSGVDQAISSAGKHKFDLLLLDIGLNERRTGVEVLHTIRKMKGHEGVPAIACTAYSLPGLKDRYLETGFSGYLGKPFRKEQLLELIENILAAGVQLPSESTMPESMNLDLPPLPHTLARMLDLLSDKSAEDGAERLGEILEADPVVSSWVLRNANSAFLSVRGTVTTIERAVTLVGLEPVCNLVVAEVLAKTFSTLDAESSRRVYRHILQGAVAAGAYARALAAAANLKDPEIVFTAGLIHDVGRLGLLSKEKEIYAASWYEREHGNETFQPPTVGQELIRFGIDHQSMGIEVSRAWDLPVEIDQAIRHVWDPSSTSVEYRSVVFAVAGGRVAAQLFIIGDERSESVESLQSQLDSALKGLVGDRPDAVAEMKKLIETKTEAIRGLVDSIARA